MARLGKACLVLMVLFLGVGCVDVDGELKTDGSASFRYTYGPPRHATFDSERARLGSDHVTVEKIEPGAQVTAMLAVDDLEQIGSAAAFAEVRAEVDRSARRLQLSLPGFDDDTRQQVLADPTSDDKQALRVSIVLPGSAQDAAPPAALDGRRVTWTVSIADYARAGDRIELGVRWAPLAGDTAAAHSM